MWTLLLNHRYHTIPYQTTGGNFINVLQAAFVCADPKSAKKIDNLTVFFTLLGSTPVKADRRMLMKLTPGALHERVKVYLLLHNFC